jgi:hypothetical protein
MAPVISVTPETPVSFAVHVLATRVAVNGSVKFKISAELLTDPDAGVPCVLTVMDPEENTGGADPEAAVLVTGVVDPPGGSATVGVGPTSAGGELSKSRW